MDQSGTLRARLRNIHHHNHRLIRVFRYTSGEWSQHLAHQRQVCPMYMSRTVYMSIQGTESTYCFVSMCHLHTHLVVRLTLGLARRMVSKPIRNYRCTDIPRIDKPMCTLPRIRWNNNHTHNN